MSDEAVIERRGPGRPAKMRLPDDAVPPPPAPVIPKGYEPMDTAPLDGKVIMLRSAPDEKGKCAEVLALYRHTRRFDMDRGIWSTRDFWAMANSGGTPVGWEPAAWRARVGLE